MWASSGYSLTAPLDDDGEADRRTDLRSPSAVRCDDRCVRQEASDRHGAGHGSYLAAGGFRGEVPIHQLHALHHAARPSLDRQGPPRDPRLPPPRSPTTVDLPAPPRLNLGKCRTAWECGCPEEARPNLREQFVRHIIGGKIDVACCWSANSCSFSWPAQRPQFKPRELQLVRQGLNIRRDLTGLLLQKPVCLASVKRTRASAGAQLAPSPAGRDAGRYRHEALWRSGIARAPVRGSACGSFAAPVRPVPTR